MLLFKISAVFSFPLVFYWSNFIFSLGFLPLSRGISYSIYSRFWSRTIFGTERNLYNNLALFIKKLRPVENQPVNVTWVGSVLAKIS